MKVSATTMADHVVCDSELSASEHSECVWIKNTSQLHKKPEAVHQVVSRINMQDMSETSELNVQPCPY